MENVEIDLQELRLIIQRIFEYMESDLGLKKLTLDKDFYWDVPSEDRYDLTRSPETCDVGQLYDDWGFLRPILQDKSQALPLMLIHVAPLLLWIGENIGEQGSV